MIDWLATGIHALQGTLQVLRACQHPFNVHSICAELDAADFSLNPDEYTMLCPFIAALFWSCIASPGVSKLPSMLDHMDAPLGDGRFGHMYGPLNLLHTNYAVI